MVNHRNDRVASTIHREISQLLNGQLTDPRLNHIVTVSEVSLSSDFSKATIGVTVLADSQSAVEVAAGLNSASGYLRKELGTRLSLKRTPLLEFVLDTKINEGDSVLELLDTIKSEYKEDDEAGY
ncbi:MAG: ribosome-binding factor A [Chloroflexi bacterium]|jgi:ribosome-binding factor A|nr:ribosome-binding factor A [Chloroflexota bacterium]MBN86383.1 ribosome-binding factor A [Dehalococcoidia bacterium]MCH2531611.1 30S ribosome-binding factor RbfA [Dehalococcoidia bacterium]HCH35936.1 30S ribosome-binding factor RbfA [Dehalococcoidia bacterium]|tara:strand:- start:2705 stop:3079 length:375 start_codon:yes stop_codon:yes gene_type:complete